MVAVTHQVADISREDGMLLLPDGALLQLDYPAGAQLLTKSYEGGTAPAPTPELWITGKNMANFAMNFALLINLT